MLNRRNYYRILQVQHDAPVEIIRASYRTILRELKKHPDLGGDNYNASIINEAYEILSDNNKRAEYDKELMESYMQKGLNRRTFDRTCITDKTSVIKSTSGQTIVKEPVPVCNGTKDDYTENMTKRNDRRAVHRMKKNGKIHYDVSSLQTGQDAEMQDLSPQGISFISTNKVMTNMTIQINSPSFKALARVMRSEAGQRNGQCGYSIGARFLSIKFRNPKGSFYSKVVDEACA